MKAARKNGRARQDIGVFFLSVTGAFSLWSATNTSYTGHMAFGLKDPKSARTAMNLGLGFIGLQTIALLFLYGKRAYAAAGGAIVTGAALYAIYDYALRHGAPTNTVSDGQPSSAGALPPRGPGSWIEAGKIACSCQK
jgi:hypothetical protein